MQSIYKTDELNDIAALKSALCAAEILVLKADTIENEFEVLTDTAAVFGQGAQELCAELEELFKFTERRLYAQLSKRFAHPSDGRSMFCVLKRAFGGERVLYYARLKCADGEYIWCKIDLIPELQDGKVSAVTGIIVNVNEIMCQSARHKELSELDELTGLLNRRGAERAVSAIFRENSEGVHAAIVIDLDGFKSVNDNYGHLMGDLTLKKAAAHIKSCFRASDVVARWGGDEFFVLMRDVPSRDILKTRLDLLLKPFSDKTSLSIGAALNESEKANIERMFKKADDALFVSKETKNCYNIVHL